MKLFDKIERENLDTPTDTPKSSGCFQAILAVTGRLTEAGRKGREIKLGNSIPFFLASVYSLGRNFQEMLGIKKMSWDDKIYHFYLIFGENNPKKEPWLENEWFNNFEPLFNKIIEISSYKKDTGLRVYEMEKKDKTSEYYKEYKLGKLNFDRKSHEKWTLKTNDARYFISFQSWTPRWTICDKIKDAPDIFLSIKNENDIRGKFQVQFDTMIIIAINESIGNIDIEIIKELSKNFNSKRTVYTKRGWFKGKIDKNRKWSLHDWMDCISSGNGIYKEAKNLNMHTIKFNKIEFEPYWEIIY